jgi:hypothetical protein
MAAGKIASPNKGCGAMIGNKIAILAASGLLAVSMGIASAQTGAPGSPANQGKCWDAASKQIKNKTAMSGSASGSAGVKSGAATTGSGASGSAKGDASANRPAAAIGLPEC